MSLGLARRDLVELHRSRWQAISLAFRSGSCLLYQRKIALDTLHCKPATHLMRNVPAKRPQNPAKQSGLPSSRSGRYLCGVQLPKHLNKITGCPWSWLADGVHVPWVGPKPVSLGFDCSWRGSADLYSLNQATTYRSTLRHLEIYGTCFGSRGPPWG